MFEASQENLLMFLDEIGSNYRIKGSEVVMPCPQCKSKDGGFSINLQTTQFKCHRENKCGFSGNLVDLMRFHGMEPYEKKDFRKPDPQRALESLEKTDYQKFLDWYSDREGLSVAVLARYKIGYEKNQFGHVIVKFPYFQDGELINVKHRNINEKAQFTEKGAKIQFFGSQFIKPENRSIIVCEGEKDCMALVDLGFENVLSVPMGARNFSPSMKEYLKEINPQKIYLMFDADEAGQTGAKEFARKAGPRRCYNVVLPAKDPRECILQGKDKDDILERMEVAKKYDFSDDLENDELLSVDEQLERFEKEVIEAGSGIQTGIEMLDVVCGGGFLPKQVIGIVAEPGCFKTATLQKLLADRSIEMNNEFCAFFSMEMNAEREVQRRLQMDFGWTKDFLREGAKNRTQSYLSKKAEFIKRYKNLLTTDRNHLNVPQISRIIKNTEDSTGKKCRIVGIDFLGQINPESKNAFDPIGEIMDGIVNKIAKELKVTVIVLIHTNRQRVTKEYGLTLSDGKGGRSIEQLLDTYIGLFKDTELDEVMGRFLKHRDYEGTPYETNPYFRLEIDKFVVQDFRYTTMDEIQTFKKKSDDFC